MEKLLGERLQGEKELKNTQAELIALLKRHISTEGSNSTAIKSLSFYKSTRPNTFNFEMYEPSVCLVMQGTKAVTLGEQVLVYTPAHYLLVAVSMPLVAQIGEASPALPYLAIIISLVNSEIANLFSVVKTLPPHSEMIEKQTRGLARGNVDAPLLDAAGRLVRLLDTPEHIEVLAPLIMRELVYRLLIGPQGPILREVVLANGKMHRLAGSIERLRYHYNQPLHVEKLAKEAGMSVSSLHFHFKAVTSLSPLQYLKRVRLHEARKLILTEQADVTNASLQVGYESASQFSREYRRLFGIAPSQDGRRLRNIGEVISSALPTTSNQT